MYSFSFWIKTGSVSVLIESDRVVSVWVVSFLVVSVLVVSGTMISGSSGPLGSLEESSFEHAQNVATKTDNKK